MENDVPQILPRDRSNAYEILLAARNAGKAIWLVWPKGVFVVSVKRPNANATRMFFADRSEAA